MATQSEIETQLAAIESTIQSGVEMVQTDGTSTRVNLGQLKSEAERLRRILATKNMRRPVVSGVKFSGFQP